MASKSKSKRSQKRVKKSAPRPVAAVAPVIEVVETPPEYLNVPPPVAVRKIKRRSQLRELQASRLAPIVAPAPAPGPVVPGPGSTATAKPSLFPFSSEAERDAWFASVGAAKSTVGAVGVEAGRRMQRAADRKRALDALDQGVAFFKAIPFPQPADTAIDAFAETMRKAVHELYPE